MATSQAALTMSSPDSIEGDGEDDAEAQGGDVGAWTSS